MRKRRKFVIASLLLAVSLLLTQFVTVEFPWRYLSIFALFGVSYLVSTWALFGDLKGIEWVVVVPMQGILATSVALFYFLLPEALISRVVIFMLFTVASYGLLLTSNIYSVAAIRTIQLLRAAHAVGFLLILISALLFFNTIFSFKFPFMINGLLVFLVSFPLVLNGLWSVKLEPELSPTVLWYSLVIPLVLGEVAVAISFWPVTVWVASLFLVAALYLLLGLTQHHFQGRLFKKTFDEYAAVGVFVLVVTMVVTQWR